MTHTPPSPQLKCALVSPTSRSTPAREPSLNPTPCPIEPLPIRPHTPRVPQAKEETDAKLEEARAKLEQRAAEQEAKREELQRSLEAAAAAQAEETVRKLHEVDEDLATTRRQVSVWGGCRESVEEGQLGGAGGAGGGGAVQAMLYSQNGGAADICHVVTLFYHTSTNRTGGRQP